MTMRHSLRPLLPALLITAMLSFPAMAFDVEVDPDSPAYTRVEGVGGRITSEGSDTLLNMMTFWSEGFRRHYPNVQIAIQGKGSSTAPTALTAGIAQIGPMSREMKPSEIEAFEARYGFPPTPIAVAIDSLAVFVHKDNPIESINLPQVDAIFSSTRIGGYPRDIRTWGDLGLTGTWAGLPLSLYGRNSVSGTYGYFKEKALFDGDFKDAVKEQPGSASVVMGISEDIAGVGYSGIGYTTSGVRTVPLAKSEGEPAYEATPENILGGNYPLSRLLYVYIVKDPNEPLDTVTQEFLKYILSAEGQQDVIKDGYMPLPAAIITRERAKFMSE